MQLYITTRGFGGIGSRDRALFPAGGQWLMQGPDASATLREGVPPIPLWGP